MMMMMTVFKIGSVELWEGSGINNSSKNLVKTVF